jgi:hypothetical protein
MGFYIGIEKWSKRMAQEEQVLVVERKVFEDVGTFHGLNFEVERSLFRVFPVSYLGRRQKKTPHISNSFLM